MWVTLVTWGYMGLHVGCMGLHVGFMGLHVGCIGLHTGYMGLHVGCMGLHVGGYMGRKSVWDSVVLCSLAAWS